MKPGASGARIRRARPQDAAALLALERHFPTDRMSRRSIRNFLSSPSVTVWVAQQGHEVVAALVLLFRRNSRSARIYSLVVSPAARGLGLARRLVRLAEKAARRRACRRLSLEVRQDNTAALALYRSLGYAHQARLAAYYEDGVDALRLARHLDG